MRREAFLKAFSTSDGDAFLDICAFGGLQVPEVVLDVTVRHPAVAQYQPGSSQRPGMAAAAAEEDKQKLYPPAGGRQVIPMCCRNVGKAWGIR